LAAGALFACATPRALRSELSRLLGEGKYTEAAKVVEGAKTTNYKEKNAFLYYLDLGMLLHDAGRYNDSNQAFEQAKRVSTELFTKSVSQEASTFLTSDNARPYYGEDFERALVHVFSALNYVFLGQGGEALVEARQVDFLLQKLRTDFGHKNVYTEDAFVRYLMGMIYENEGQVNDAYISYYKALEAYDTYKKNFGQSAPAALVEDALRTAKKLGFRDQMDMVRKKWGGAPPDAAPADTGELVVLHYNGLPPAKADFFFEIGFVKGWAYVDAQAPQGEEQETVEKINAGARSLLADDAVRMAFPRYVATPYAVRGLTLSAAGVECRAELVEDVGAIAVKSLEDRVARIRAKTIARAVVKYALAKNVADAVEKKKGEDTGWLVKKLLQVANTLTELSDKRAWQTVPDKILIARARLPAGKQKATLTFVDASGAAVSTRELADVEIVAGKKTFVAVRTAR